MGLSYGTEPLIFKGDCATVWEGPLAVRCAQLLQRAVTSTGASGGTIASFLQNAGMVTRASAGVIGPDAASQVCGEGSLATLHVLAGHILRCDDAATDPRVDASACRALGIRSMVIVPVHSGDRVEGLLALFATRRDAFSVAHIGVLQSIAALVGEGFQRQRYDESAITHPVRPSRAQPEPSDSGLTSQDEQAPASGEPGTAVSASVAHEAHPEAEAASAKILRFLKSERLVHWSIAIPFVICFVTALVLVIFYNPHPQRHFRLLFSWIHRLAGACLAVLPLLVLLAHSKDYKTHLHNIKHGWIWVLDDVKWLFLMGPATLSSRIALPEQGKFNAAEKLNFMMVMGSFPLFVFTGILLWMPGFHFLPWLAHVGMAFVATPLMLGHIFMATVNPSTRVGLDGMLSGYVDRHWAKHHYRRWYRENFEPAPSDQLSRAKPSKQAGRCPACSRPAKSWGRFAVLGLQAATCPSCGAEMPGQ